MDSNALEGTINRLRKLLLEKVPDLLLQAECGGGLEVPTPLPWGFASVPTLYELATTAERELDDVKEQQEMSYRRWREAQDQWLNSSANRRPHPSAAVSDLPPAPPDLSPGPRACTRDNEEQERHELPPPLHHQHQQHEQPFAALEPVVDGQQQGDAWYRQYGRLVGYEADPIPRELELVHEGKGLAEKGRTSLGTGGLAGTTGRAGAWQTRGPDAVSGDDGGPKRGGECSQEGSPLPQDCAVAGAVATARLEAAAATAAVSGGEGSLQVGALTEAAAAGGVTRDAPATGTVAEERLPHSDEIEGDLAGGGGRGGGANDVDDPGGCADAAAAAERDRDGEDCRTGEPSPAREAGPPMPPPPPGPYACRAFLESLEQSRTFRSPHCEVAMAEAMGVMELYDGLAGSTLGPPPDRRQLEALRAMLKEHINTRWSLEAVKQGVAAAKQGSYADAHKAYARALELDPASAEAYVARGAAHANQRAFADAERDLRRALELDPGHRNAMTYLDAVLRHVEQQRQQLEALEEERQLVLARQQHPPPPPSQQQQQRDRRRQQVEAAAICEADGMAGRRGDAVQGRWAGGSPGTGTGTVAPTAAAAAGGARGHESRYGTQGPSAAALGRLSRGPHDGAAPPLGRGWTAAAEVGEGQRRRDSDATLGASGSSESGSSSGGGDGDSSGGTPGRGRGQGGRRGQPASDDIRRALEVVLKARKLKKKSKRKKQEKKSKKSKRRRRS